MNVKINNVLYEGVQWVYDTMTFETEMTLAEIEQAFTPGANADIIVSEGNEDIARYYNKGLESITVSWTEPRIVAVKFNVTQISENAETEIHGEIEDSDGAIVELAEIVGNMSEMDIEGMKDDIHSLRETVDTWFNYSADLANFINDLRKEGGILDQFNVRITALEQIVGAGEIEVVNDEQEGE